PLAASPLRLRLVHALRFLLCRSARITGADMLDEDRSLPATRAATLNGLGGWRECPCLYRFCCLSGAKPDDLARLFGRLAIKSMRINSKIFVHLIRSFPVFSGVERAKNR